MIAQPSLRAVLPRDGADWRPVSSGESGAVVLHDRVGARFAKVVPGARVRELADERDRVAWLQQTDVPGASVLDWRVRDEAACLVTSAVAGVGADRLSASELRRAWPSIAATLRALHGIPLKDCPFERGVETMMALARATVASSRVQPEFLPEELQDVPPAVILRKLEAGLPSRVADEAATRVVCHGDACLPNLLVDPASLRVTGVIDVGRLGIADPCADIALLLATARETWPDDAAAIEADREFSARYGVELDADRLRFYLLLDPLTWPAAA